MASTPNAKSSAKTTIGRYPIAGTRRRYGNANHTNGWVIALAPSATDQRAFTRPR